MLKPVFGREGNTSVVTEIGLAFFTASGRGTFRHRHILVEEHLSRRNGKWVADNRDRFLFGNSEVMPLAQAGTVSECLLDTARPCALNEPYAE